MLQTHARAGLLARIKTTISKPQPKWFGFSRLRYETPPMISLTLLSFGDPLSASDATVAPQHQEQHNGLLRETPTDRSSALRVAPRHGSDEHPVESKRLGRPHGEFFAAR